MDALKRLAARARQKSAEVILSAEKTEIGAEIEELLTKTDKTEEHLKKLIHAIEVYLQPNPAIRALDPRKDKSGRQNTLDGLGETMKETAKAVGIDSVFGVALMKASTAESKMGAAERQLIHTATTQTVASIRHVLDNELRTVQKERSVLGKKRLDLDATKSRWKRASSADKKAQIEAELRTAQTEFDNQLDIICTALTNLQTAVDQLGAHLAQFVQTQLQYYSSCAQHLAELARALGAR